MNRVFRFSLQLLSATFFILRGERDMIKKYVGRKAKYLLIMSYINAS